MVVDSSPGLEEDFDFLEGDITRSIVNGVLSIEFSNGPLIPQVLVNGKAQRMEYKALPSICFGCGRYGHTKNLCPHIFGNSNSTREKGETIDPAIGENMSAKVAEAFGSWM
ncbi:hypothetical protein Goarm_003381, partial [Gossypium armourianum]|nr:hypothetical protein [Gossypium armourianum]